VFPKELFYGEYLFEKFLGSGGQGFVCLYREAANPSNLFAVKFDPPD
jgi:hypothetical protein